MNWQKRLRNMSEFLEQMKKKDYGLLHDYQAVGPSTIARQFFCERKVDFRCKHGEIHTEEKQLGAEIHDAQLIGTKHISTEELIKSIEQKWVLIVHELPLSAEIKGFPVRGRVDTVIFFQGYPRIVAELKNTTSTPRIYQNHRVQARMYGLLLDAVGFDCSDLELLIASQHVNAQQRNPPKGFYPKDLDQIVIHLRSHGKVNRLRRKENYYRELFPFDRDQALKELAWATEYWWGTREAIPTRNTNKCKVCEYKECERKDLFYST
ncbi:MAG: hypothetical protein GWO20_13575 [Candidatus Korarchaeota archaeon]|nr:hypothetical protein [Candidatus Korarchaeota archaeon]NIU84295.1 hypothetical protein [Candidatus Thorarchaeota archaeon]NIW15799.1 hypothetical protein [Candidatus Thorarchaeota archaeon]NIW53713.1 hypothetical protein [Candidatus Korarchaeota archaeon]